MPSDKLTGQAEGINLGAAGPMDGVGRRFRGYRLSKTISGIREGPKILKTAFGIREIWLLSSEILDICLTSFYVLFPIALFILLSKFSMEICCLSPN